MFVCVCGWRYSPYMPMCEVPLHNWLSASQLRPPHADLGSYKYASAFAERLLQPVCQSGYVKVPSTQFTQAQFEILSCSNSRAGESENLRGCAECSPSRRPPASTSLGVCHLASPSSESPPEPLSPTRTDIDTRELRTGRV